MSWLLLTLSCIILWGITDILYKKSSTYTDPLSHYKTFVWIGMVMAPACVIMAIYSDTLPDSIMMVKDNLYLIPLCIFYAIALLFGLLGMRHLDASVVSPLENIDGAMAAIILYCYFLFAGYHNVTSSIGTVDMIATVSIVVGVILLGIQEQTLSKQERNFAEHKKRHRLGALALIFPILYNLVDAVSMVAVGITVSEETEVAIPDIDFFIFESLGFAAVAILIWLYMLMVKKYRYNPFQKEELVRCSAAICETFGTMAFIFAVGSNPILTAPITSSYCLVTIVLAHIFLKERLTRRQYLSLVFLVIGIALLGVSEIFNV
ncbi:MAG: EamA family transporter [Peptococcaceae bacterium]|nr:EamA family transporter [Peptococcaceae bacterium]